jgi:phosphatidylserine decarboxylase
MATPSGLMLFHDALFASELKLVLEAWAKFLSSSASLDKLDVDDPEKPGSWISQRAHAAGVWQDTVHDPAVPAYGFTSWNDFFLRRFRPGARPFKGDPAVCVFSPCETLPWTSAQDLELRSQFWVKDNVFSLEDVLGSGRRWAALFAGGSLYQGFLSPDLYHRWHSPVDGELVRSWVEPGLYLAQRPGQGQGPGTWHGTRTQPYLAHVATRAICLFRHPACGYVAVVFVGMVEVSSCVPRMLVSETDDPVPVRRGDEIGHFAFGGSSVVVLFQAARVRVSAWALQADGRGPVAKLGTILARQS